MKSMIAKLTLRLFVVACGTDEPTEPGGPDAQVPSVDAPTQSADASTTPMPDASSDDPFAADPSAEISLVDGTIADCLPSFLSGGGVAIYSGFAGSSDGVYLVWKDSWNDASVNFRVETWDAFGGISSPGTYTIKQSDTNYLDCAVCIFAETGAGNVWLTPGSSITFTSLKTGDKGIGERVEGKINGFVESEFCSGSISVSFSGIARSMEYGPL